MDSYQRSPKLSGETPQHEGTARRSRLKGPPVEVVVWQIVEQKGHGEHRIRIGNYRLEGFERLWTVNHPGEGRYRIEFRDTNGTIVRVQYANAPAPGKGPPRYTQGRHRPSQRKMPAPLPAWLRPARPTTVQVYDRNGAPTGRTRIEALHDLPPPPQWDGQTWILRIDGLWIVLPDETAIPMGYKPMLLHRERWVWVPVFSDGWIGFHKGQTQQGEPCFLPDVDEVPQTRNRTHPR